MLLHMATTHGPSDRDRATSLRHRRHLTLVPKAGASPSPAASPNHETSEAVHSAASEISFAAELLGAAPAEIGSLAELRKRLSSICGAVTEETLGAWIDRLPNPKYLGDSPQTVQANVLRIVQEIALEREAPEAARAARDYLREHRRNSLELLSKV